MVVETDKKSGFCFGVHNAVRIAEEALTAGEKVYSLGQIVHNDREVERLASLGLVTIGHDELRTLSNCKILIRAHGEPPSTYRIAQENNITIIEDTCPIVKKLQSRIREAWQRAGKANGQIVVYGKPLHAEVIGLLGQTENEGILISGPEDLGRIDFSRPVTLFSQTTMDIDAYDRIKDLIREKMANEGKLDPGNGFEVHNTVCGQVSNREPHLRTFAKNHDVIVFVSGRESSNGKMLYQVCKSVNPETYFITSAEEIDPSWFNGKNSVGICGATSTPRWLIESVREHISGL